MKATPSNLYWHPPVAYMKLSTLADSNFMQEMKGIIKLPQYICITLAQK